jgi:hypothetical protein
LDEEISKEDWALPPFGDSSDEEEEGSDWIEVDSINRCFFSLIFYQVCLIKICANLPLNHWPSGICYHAVNVQSDCLANFFSLLHYIWSHSVNIQLACLYRRFTHCNVSYALLLPWICWENHKHQELNARETGGIEDMREIKEQQRYETNQRARETKNQLEAELLLVVLEVLVEDGVLEVFVKDKLQLLIFHPCKNLCLLKLIKFLHCVANAG